MDYCNDIFQAIAIVVDYNITTMLNNYLYSSTKVIHINDLNVPCLSSLSLTTVELGYHDFICSDTLLVRSHQQLLKVNRILMFMKLASIRAFWAVTSHSLSFALPSEHATDFGLKQTKRGLQTFMICNGRPQIDYLINIQPWYYSHQNGRKFGWRQKLRVQI